MIISTRNYIYSSPLGPLLMRSREGILIECRFVDKEALTNVNSDTPDEALLEAILWLDSYFRGEEMPLPVHIGITGTPFQREVRMAACRIPFGKTASYRDIAIAIGRPKAVRAVAGALAANPLMLFVPCHRVIGSDGKMHGYAGGISRKPALLKIESKRSNPLPPRLI